MEGEHLASFSSKNNANSSASSNIETQDVNSCNVSRLAPVYSKLKALLDGTLHTSDEGVAFCQKEITADGVLVLESRCGSSACHLSSTSPTKTKLFQVVSVCEKFEQQVLLVVDIRPDAQTIGVANRP
jgi:hypothetical protein